MEIKLRISYGGTAKTQTVKHNLEFALGDFLGIKLLNRPSREITRISIKRFTGFFARLINALKLGEG